MSTARRSVALAPARSRAWTTTVGRIERRERRARRVRAPVRSTSVTLPAARAELGSATSHAAPPTYEQVKDQLKDKLFSAAVERQTSASIAELRRNGPNALMELKRFFDAIGEYPPSDERAAFTAQTISRVRATPEAKEGFAAFFAKRPPAWEAGAE